MAQAKQQRSQPISCNIYKTHKHNRSAQINNYHRMYWVLNVEVEVDVIDFFLLNNLLEIKIGLDSISIKKNGKSNGACSHSYSLTHLLRTKMKTNIPHDK